MSESASMHSFQPLQEAEKGWGEITPSITRHTFKLTVGASPYTPGCNPSQFRPAKLTISPQWHEEVSALGITPTPLKKKWRRSALPLAFGFINKTFCFSLTQLISLLQHWKQICTNFASP